MFCEFLWKLSFLKGCFQKKLDPYTIFCIIHWVFVQKLQFHQWSTRHLLPHKLYSSYLLHSECNDFRHWILQSNFLFKNFLCFPSILSDGEAEIILYDSGSTFCINKIKCSIQSANKLRKKIKLQTSLQRFKNTQNLPELA